MTIDDKNKYTKMQKDHYEQQASTWSLDNRDPVVGSFDLHNDWEDYDLFLFKNIPLSGKVAMDFGCGPGRNIVKFSKLFDRIDGVDISQNNLDKAKLWCDQNKLAFSPNLFMNNGVDISCIKNSDQYDVVFSTICLQHICVYEIRFSILSDFYRILKPGGYVCIQMGFGSRNNSSHYFDNNYDALGTNSFCDVRIENVDALKDDLSKIGFVDFDYDIRPVGPGDQHQNWIFFRAKK